MGVCLSWFAVRGSSREAVLEQLELEGAHAPYRGLPDVFGVAELPDGWLLLVCNHDLKAAFEERFVALSHHGSAVACAIEEHVMFQEARGYEDGAEVWRVTHDPDKGQSLYHLEITGTPPANLDKIHRQAIAEQDEEGEDAGVDLISDVPLALAKCICGFRHDDDWPEDLRFTELRRPKAAPGQGRDGPGFLRRLFGRR
jgi:hypothetical protein